MVKPLRGKFCLGRRGQTAFVGMMLAMMLIIAAIVMIEPLKSVIGIARDADHLNCADDSQSVGVNMTCIITDWNLPIFIGMCFAVAWAYIGMRRYQESQQ